MGLFSSDPAAENVARVVTNSMVTQVNDATMVCETSSKNINYAQVTVDIIDSEGATTEINVTQTTNAVVSPHCMMSSEVVNASSVALSTDLEQTAEAVQAGVIPPPGVKNTSEVIQNVSQNLLNTYTSTCAMEAQNVNFAKANVTVNNSPNSQTTVNLSQENTSEFMAECISRNLQTIDGSQELTTTISQIASTKNRNLFLVMAVALTIMVVSILVLGITLKLFGKDIARHGWKVALTIGLFFLVVIGGMFGVSWLMSIGPWYEETQPYTDGDHQWNPDKQEFECKEGYSKPPGYVSCIRNTYGDVFWSYACTSEAHNYNNAYIDWAYYYNNPEQWDKLPYTVFNGINCLSGTKETDPDERVDMTDKIRRVAQSYCTKSERCTDLQIGSLCNGAESLQEKYTTPGQLAERLGSVVMEKDGYSLYGSANMGLCCGPGKISQFAQGWVCVDAPDGRVLVDPVDETIDQPVTQHYGCGDKAESSGAWICDNMLNKSFVHMLWEQMKFAKAFSDPVEGYDIYVDIIKKLANETASVDEKLLMHEAVVDVRWDRGNKKDSPFNLTWLGNGVTTAQWNQLTGRTTDVSATPYNANYYANPRGFVCIHDNVDFIFHRDPEDSDGSSTYAVRADDIFMVGERTVNSGQCVGGQSLSLSKGFACMDYNQSASEGFQTDSGNAFPRGNMSLSMCCETELGGMDSNRTLPTSCTPYSSWKNPYTCSPSNANYQRSIEDYCGTCRGVSYLGNTAPNPSQPCAHWKDQSVRFTELGLCQSNDKDCPFG